MAPGWGKTDTRESWQQQSPQPPQKFLSHSISFVKQNKVIFDKMICQATRGVKLGVEVTCQSQQIDPKPWHGSH